MKHFDNVKTAADLKKAYLELAKKHHPDKGGDPEVMKAINAEYEQIRKRLQKFADSPFTPKDSADGFDWETVNTNELPETLREAIFKIASLDGIEIEICGKWIWVEGNTRKHTGVLKAAGYRWAPKKKMWYWREEKEERHNSRGRYDIGRIRTRYGSAKVSPTLSIN